MRSSKGAGAAFSNGTRRDGSKMAAGTLEFMSALRTGPRAPGRACKPSLFVLRAAKSFEVLSVRVRSSGNSEATTPHNRMESSDQTRSFRVLVRANTILQPLEQVIRLLRIRINGKNRDSNQLSSGIETDDCGGERVGYPSICLPRRLHTFADFLRIDLGVLR